MNLEYIRKIYKQINKLDSEKNEDLQILISLTTRFDDYKGFEGNRLNFGLVKKIMLEKDSVFEFNAQVINDDRRYPKLLRKRFNTLFGKKIFSRGLLCKGFDKEQVDFIWRFVNKEVPKYEENPYCASYVRMRNIIYNQIRYLMQIITVIEKVNVNRNYQPEHNQIRLQIDNELKRLESEKHLFENYDPELFNRISEGPSFMTRRKSLKLVGTALAIGTGIVLLNPILSQIIKSYAYAGEITESALPRSSWLSKWIRDQYPRYKVPVKCVWRELPRKCTRVELAEFISEAMGLACYYSGTTCYKKVQVVIGSDRITTGGAYIMDDNSIHVSKTVLTTYGKKNFASMYLFLGIMHEMIHYLDMNYTLRESLKNFKVINSWMIRRTTPPNAKEVNKRIDYMLYFLRSSENRAMAAQLKYYNLFLQENLTSAQRRFIHSIIDTINYGLAQVNDGTYSGFREWEDIRQKLLRRVKR